MSDDDRILESVLTPVATASVTREVAAKLLDYLSSGNIEPGGRLPSERKLAETMRVGRSAIRETLAALEVLGVIDTRPGSGTYLRGHSTDLLPTVINWGLALGQPRTLALVEARSELELITVRLAAERATPEDIARLKVHIEKMTEQQGDLSAFIEADVAFHLEVADTARNLVLADILHSVRSLLRVWVERAVKAEGSTSGTLAEHLAIFRAIQQSDPESAVLAMKAHMNSAGARLRRSLETAEPPPGRQVAINER